MTDAELLDQHRGGSETAFAELVRRHVNWVHAIARRRVGDSHLAEDVTQAAFTLLWRKAPRLNAGQALSPWLFPVVSFFCKRMLRVEYRRRLRETEAAKMQNFSSPQVESSVQWAEISTILDELVGRLHSGDRQALLLRFYEQKSFPEIGQAMRISGEAARKRVVRATEKLRAMLTRRGVAIGAAALTTALTSELIPPASAAVVAGATAAHAGAGGSLVKAVNAALWWAMIKPAALVASVIVTAGIATTAIVLQVRAQPAGSVAAAPSPPPATAPTTVAADVRYGRVVTEDDKPVVNARVWQVEYESPDRFRTTASTTTRADGRFELPGAGTYAYQKGIAFQADGFGITGAHLAQGLADDPEDVQIKPPTQLRVHFVGPDAKPAAGVRVSLISAGSAIIPWEMKDQIAQTTDASGQCELPGMPRGGSARLLVLDDRFAQLSYDEDIKLDDAVVTDAEPIHLQSAGHIQGRVIYGDSQKPVAGITVLASDTSPRRAGPTMKVKTDIDGRYEFDTLRNTEYCISLQLPAEINAHYTAAAQEHILIVPGAHLTDQDFILISGGIIRGRIVAQDTGKPLARVEVSMSGPAHPNNTNYGQDAYSDNDGYYVTHVPAGKQYVQFGMPPPLGMLEPRPYQYYVDIVDNQTIELNFEVPLNPAPPAKGRAVDPDGHPLSNVSVLVERKNENGNDIQATTDAAGNFTIPAVESGSKLRARKGRWATVDPVTVGAGSSDIKLVLQPNALATLRVQVLQEDGKPISGAQVDLIENVEGVGAGEKKTADGVCVFKSLYPDTQYHLDLWAKGYASVTNANVRIEPGKTTDAGPFYLVKADSFIAGMVVDENGQPVPDIQVNGSGHASGYFSAKTDVNGRFRFNGVVAGDQLRVSAQRDQLSANNERSPVQTVAAGTQDAVIIFQPSPLPKAP